MSDTLNHSSPAERRSGRPPGDALPPPEPAELEATLALRQLLRDEIAGAGGAISFARYMELALYAPGRGYYSGGRRVFGAGGDFVTAPEISPLFGYCVARQCAEVLERLGGDGLILESGAGSGALAAAVLEKLEQGGALPRRYLILELSGSLRSVQQQTLRARVPHLLQRVGWLDRLPAEPLRGVVLANEVLDAMPVHRVELLPGPAGGGGTGAVTAREWYVAATDTGFEWRRGPLSTPALQAALAPVRAAADLADRSRPYLTEVGLAQPAWVRTVGALLAAGLMLIVDYGLPRRELYHPQRDRGTLRCHYRQRAHDDPLILTGLQDITSHVDFTALAEAGDQVGLRVAGFTTQADFLFATGLLDEARSQGDGVEARLRAANAVKRLTLPTAMGETFKVLALTRDLQLPLRGFALRDHRGRL